MAAGAWSGDLLADSLADDRWRHVFKPRRGHLLEVQAPPSMAPLQHGLMELGYTQVAACHACWCLGVHNAWSSAVCHDGGHCARSRNDYS